MKRFLRPSLAACAFALASLSIAGATSRPYDPFFAGQATVADFGAGTRPFGNAAADFDKDGKVDLVVGRALGQVSILTGNGDGTFAAATTYRGSRPP
jgi:FG-GAP-like repeat